MELHLETPSGEVSFEVQKKLYPLESLQGAAHALREKADAFVEEDSSHYRVTLRAKRAAQEKDLRLLAGHFLDEILGQALRNRLLSANSRLTEYIVTRAILSMRRDPADPLQQPQVLPEEFTEEERRETEVLLEEARRLK